MAQQATKLITIQQVNNGFIISNEAGQHNVIENGNEVDMVRALEQYFGFKVFDDSDLNNSLGKEVEQQIRFEKTNGSDVDSLSNVLSPSSV